MSGHVIEDPRATERLSAITAKRANDNVSDAEYWTLERSRRMFAPSLFLLPFVTLPTKDEFCKTAWKTARLWNDEPTDDISADFRRGKEYARLAMAAMVADNAVSCPLEQVVKAIVQDAITRRGKGGRLRRRLTPAAEGFLCELVRVTVASSRRLAKREQS